MCKISFDRFAGTGPSFSTPAVRSSYNYTSKTLNYPFNLSTVSQSSSVKLNQVHITNYNSSVKHYNEILSIKQDIIIKAVSSQMESLILNDLLENIM